MLRAGLLNEWCVIINLASIIDETIRRIKIGDGTTALPKNAATDDSSIFTRTPFGSDDVNPAADADNDSSISFPPPPPPPQQQKQQLLREELIDLYTALAQLFVYSREFEKTIKIYLLLKDATVFGVINKYKLFRMVKDRIVELMAISPDQSIRLLLDNEDLTSSDQVLAQLGREPRLQVPTLLTTYTRFTKKMWY